MREAEEEINSSSYLLHAETFNFPWFLEDHSTETPLQGSQQLFWQ